ncbi:MAG: NAD(P)-binding domain-containing protein [Campylobacteraceae bacterium]|nr:NAD(P)-binding domain-containing protein [Campylobacteraceae bacterium]
MKELYDIIVIGGGPCGLASVVEANIAGFKDVLLLEKGTNHSQTIRVFYKDNKRVDKEYKGMESETIGRVKFETGSKEDVLNYFDTLLDNDGIDAEFNTEVEKVVKGSDGLFEVFTAKQNYKAKYVIIAIGRMGKPNKPDYTIPRSLNPVVNFNLDKCGSHEKILVVGGGNSAVEYAIGLARNNLVTLSYRRNEFSRLNDINLRDIMYEERYGNLILRLGTDIESLENEEGKVVVKFKGGKELVYDRVIYAIGGSTPVDFMKNSNVKLDEDEVPIVNEYCETDIEGLYIGGDLITKKGGSIVFALNHSSTIINHIKSKN